jgi:hypothetical protein
LVDCAQTVGLNRECALLWAHYGAATIAAGCAGVCTADPVTGFATLSGPAPTCAVAECLDCPAFFSEFFTAMSGRTLPGSGMTQRMARPCSSFKCIFHDPCVGATDSISLATTTAASLTMAPPASDAATTMTTTTTTTTTPLGLVSSQRGLLMTVLLVLLA